MKSIRTFFILIITGITLLVFSVQTYISSTQVKEYAVTQQEEKLLTQALQEATSLYIPIKEISDEAITLGNMITTMPEYQEEIVLSYIKKSVQKSKSFAGAGVAFEPYAYQPDVKNHFPYTMKDKNGIPVLTWEYSVVDYHAKAWYKLGIGSQKAIDYSEPYVDQSDSNLIWVTCVHPIEKNGKRIGVAEADFTLDIFKRQLADIRVGQNGYAFALTRAGMVIGNYTGSKTEQIQDLSVKLTEVSDKEWRALGEAALQAKQAGIMQVKDNYIVYSPVGDTGMTLLLVYPAEEVFAGLNSLMYSNLILVTVSILLFVFTLSYFVNRRIVNPIRKLSETANRVAAGDLSDIGETQAGKDEIGQLAAAFATMSGNLRSLMLQVMQSSEQLASSSEELTASAEQSAQGATQTAMSITAVAAGTERQTGAVNQATAIVDRIANEINQVADNVGIVEATSGKAAGAAKEGGEAVEAAVRQMVTIETKVTHTAQIVVKLGERSKEIGQIVDTIAGIASQTNLLALNAAIEAARAGEQGRGFAVVAEEVRKLAEQSQEAAKQIAGLIGEIQSETTSAVMAMDEGTREVKIGAEVVNNAGLAFAEIVTLFDQVSEQVSKITNTVQRVAGGSQEIVAAVKEIDEINKDTASQTQTVSAVTEEQAASMEEIAAASEALAQMAETLTGAVSRFKL
ncbi:methyl-accepting chemotaxis protein [Sporomusa sphaeroides]|uniref:Methyl-accepting chemotaxis protein McpB n=1 Tax=Sporomusa sphaeroides DSM 2875 TaxID=1337886 RepID=A0ABP2C2Z8_9FIRM|nr:methyl-accepting chemotaxis protein [Sporomusa sphaeroides]OLS57377.1 methyl-accepting chemotaxis protein McpB [Sporomusa sphaeroides DSM 2875]CVK18061.1 Methyl-accepting chemotaxis protein McpB [Sporomusa sphaeroides DSM 2875]